VKIDCDLPYRVILEYQKDEQGNYQLWVRRQRSREPDTFIAQNGLCIRIDDYFDDCGSLYLLGSRVNKDDAIMYGRAKDRLERIAVAIAEYNGRKNVVKIGDRGLIY
jgi:hypothetical protein